MSGVVAGAKQMTPLPLSMLIQLMWPGTLYLQAIRDPDDHS